MTLDDFQSAAGVSTVLARRWQPALVAAMAEFGISTPERIAAFVAQTGHETLGFTLTRELWGPTPAQRAYEPPSRKAIELGNVQAGDGRRFLGRGLIQITGRANYRECGVALDADLEHQPELLEREPLAARSAAWWWARHGCNLIADAGDFVLLTRRINGGVNGLNDRMRRWALAKQALRL
jgi:putative chitinase